jgi:hypothetical protein
MFDGMNFRFSDADRRAAGDINNMVDIRRDFGLSAQVNPTKTDAKIFRCRLKCHRAFRPSVQTHARHHYRFLNRSLLN